VCQSHFLSLELEQLRMANQPCILFEDNFEVLKVDGEGKKFDDVSRLDCQGISTTHELVFDICTQVYRMKKHDKFTMALASTLNLDGSTSTSPEFDQSGEPNLLDKYEYCMHGKVFQVEHTDGSKVIFYVSFGGLLMKLSSEMKYLRNIERDANLYCWYMLRRAGHWRHAFSLMDSPSGGPMRFGLRRVHGNR